MSQILHTERLMLRPCTLADLDAVHELWTDPDIRQFLFDDRTLSRQEASDFLAASNESFVQQGYGLWLFFERSGDASGGQSSTIAGFSGLMSVPDQSPSVVFGTRPPLWGRGYAKEATAAILHYVFYDLGLDQVVADVDEPNTASIHVLEGLGMVPTGRAVVDDRPLLYYASQPSR
ncbi:GNAT family N-acetyltransferase [Nodosilinea sp. FACHB-131]|uniref:GNAT family N-acetyltransferase n=1 Tax=Cyanophyceae TaxID=3028117 RepID=UPI001683320F|nr:GNAT family N-acetyltransferase [Nodosilinea sp. FACHB-131]MBD1874532.1 GNAT family N-acetyltransferase [Nodosilinea sp. FACHB-131]